MISITYSRNGTVSIAKDGVTIAALSDPETVSETLRTLGVSPEAILTVQTASGVDNKILARNFLKPEDA